MKTIILTMLMAITVMGLPIKAVWTGEYSRFTSVTGKNGIRCKYKIEGRGTFWKSFEASTCLAVIDVY